MEKNIVLKKHACLYDISTKAFSDRVKNAAALENISHEMNVAGWYITHHNAALGTRLVFMGAIANTCVLSRTLTLIVSNCKLRADWLYAV